MRRAGSFVLVLVFVLGVWPGSASAVGGGTIAYVSERGGRGYELYVMRLDGSPAHRLTFNDVIESGPALSPDGKTIAYSSDGNLWLIGVDGTNARQLTGAYAYRPAWAPDGQSLIFHGLQLGLSGRAIFAIDIDGSDLRRVTPVDDRYWAWPAYSPDGSRIAFERSTYLFTATPTGTDLRQLGDVVSGRSQPAWSPDGRHIAYVDRGADGKTDIFVMDADGSNVRHLTDGPYADNAPAWSPDGRQIIWSANRDWNPELYVMNADGSAERRLTFDPAYGPGDAEPSWGIDPSADDPSSPPGLDSPGPGSRPSRRKLKVRAKRRQYWTRRGVLAVVTAGRGWRLSATATIRLAGRRIRLPKVERTFNRRASAKLRVRPTAAQYRTVSNFLERRPATVQLRFKATKAGSVAGVGRARIRLSSV